MEKLEVTMDISESSLETLAGAILEDLQDKVQIAIDNCDLDDKIESSIDDYDFDDKIQSWVDYNLDVESDIKDVIRHMDLSEYIDTSDLDIENNVRNLMQSFSPINACSTGQAAIEVIQSTIRYLLLKDEDFVDGIQNALDKRKARKLVEDAKNEIIEEAKPLLREQFQMELTQYNDALNAEKERSEARRLAALYPTEIPLDLV
jgi:hypothetical protein